MSNSKQCPTDGCNTEVQAQNLETGNDNAVLWECPNCDWSFELIIEESD